MSRLFWPYLLGVGLLLSQFPGETTASSLKSSSQRILCKSKVVDVIDKTCGKVRRRNADFQEEFALQYGPQSALLRTSAHKDAEALYALSDFIPNLPQDLKATLSDKQSLVRTLQHPKRRAFFLGAISIACCLFNCVGKAKKIFC